MKLASSETSLRLRSCSKGKPLDRFFRFLYFILHFFILQPKWKYQGKNMLNASMEIFYVQGIWVYSRHNPRAPTAGAELSASSVASVTIPTVKGKVQSVKNKDICSLPAFKVIHYVNLTTCSWHGKVLDGCCYSTTTHYSTKPTWSHSILSWLTHTSSTINIYVVRNTLGSSVNSNGSSSIRI